MREMITAHMGDMPMPTSSGAPTATGTPKPVMPCKKLPNTQLKMSICNSSLGANFRSPAWNTVKARASLAIS